VDGESRVVDDSLCRDSTSSGHGSHRWYYGGGYYPRGATVSGGSYEPAPGRSYTSAGGTQRGGFGSSVSSDGGDSGKSAGG
jgi:hypothetical protein